MRCSSSGDRLLQSCSNGSTYFRVDFAPQNVVVIAAANERAGQDSSNPTNKARSYPSYFYTLKRSKVHESEQITRNLLSTCNWLYVMELNCDRSSQLDVLSLQFFE